MSYADANSLLNALEIKNIDGNFEIALEVINKYGSYKKALQATIGIEFKKKEALLIALLGDEEEEKKDEFKQEAQRLINLVKAINDRVFEDSQKYSMQFSDLMKQIKLDAMISSADLQVLESVRPHYNAKLLISDINTYPNSSAQLEAFIDAIKNKSNTSKQLESTMKRLRIKR